MVTFDTFWARFLGDIYGDIWKLKGETLRQYIKSTESDSEESLTIHG